MQKTDVFRNHPRTAYRNIGGKMVIVDTLKEKLLRLNRTGTAVWERLDGRTVDQIAQEIASLFNQPFDRVLEDVEEFLEILSEKNLIQLDQIPKK